MKHPLLPHNESLVGNHPVRQENEPIRNLSERNKHSSFQPLSKIQLIYILMRLFTWFLSVYFANVILQKWTKHERKHYFNTHTNASCCMKRNSCCMNLKSCFLVIVCVWSAGRCGCHGSSGHVCRERPVGQMPRYSIQTGNLPSLS